ncbi:CHAT domain-containing protein, partial [Acidobacteriota bacterium]
LVNFASLPRGSKKYLIEEESIIHYLSAERDLVMISQESKKGEGFMAMGSPAFDSTDLFASLVPGPVEQRASKSAVSDNKLSFRGERSICADFQTMHFNPLPASLTEVREVSKIWQKSGMARRKTNALQLTGVAATEKAFKTNAPGKHVLHLATHGFFLGGKCKSALNARGVSGLGTLDQRRAAPVEGENPLLLSGLAMAGANHRKAAGPDEEDGILTAEEIASLDLSGVEWAVLSACDTGVGEIKAGEGVFGLRRAFQLAGVDTLIMSLWAVKDEPARRWMKALYKARFESGMSTAEAVRNANISILMELRRKGRSTHPFYWAGFVAAGDWR